MFYFHSPSFSRDGSSKQLGNELFTTCGNKLLSNVPIFFKRLVLLQKVGYSMYINLIVLKLFL